MENNPFESSKSREVPQRQEKLTVQDIKNLHESLIEPYEQLMKLLFNDNRKEVIANQIQLITDKLENLNENSSDSEMLVLKKEIDTIMHKIKVGLAMGLKSSF